MLTSALAGTVSDMTGTLGRALFNEALGDLERGEQSKLAAELGISATHLSDIRSGKRLPGRTLAVLLSEKFGVPPESWDKPDSSVTSAPPAAE